MKSWLLILVTILLFPLVLYAGHANLIDLDQWQFRWGDSPLDSTGKPEWVRLEQQPSWWTDVDVPVFYGSGQGHYVWLRTEIPDFDWSSPTLFLTATLYSIEIYVDTTKIYAFGPMTGKTLKFESMRWHMVPLGSQAAGKTMYIRVYSDRDTHIGLPIQADNKVMVGSQMGIITWIIQTSIDRFVLGFLFILIGFMSIDFFMHRWKQKPFIYLPFAIFTLSIGTAYTFSSEISQFVINSSSVRFVAAFSGLLLYPVGLFMFYEYVVIPAHKKIFKVFWQSLLLIGISLMFLEFANIIHFDSILYPVWVVLILMTYLFALIFGIVGAFQGSVEAKLFNAGFIIMILFTLHDILFMFGVIPYWRWMSQWGVLVFILTLLHLIERRNLEDHLKLVAYSKELQAYRDELEARVEARTRDLNERNKTLHETMRELQRTQQQLVLKEKMASLGHLVAGVAHELNNPIGAISSAANVLKRGIKRVRGELDQSGSEELLNKIGPTWDILEQNTSIISEGGERVSRIVKSLKNFARLDEAEFQIANIHEGLDSTIYLLHHEFKNRITVHKQYGEVPPIQCFPNQLNQVFLNLLANAAQAIPDKGDIYITTSCLDSYIEISIRDTGKGIQSQDLMHVFDPGFTTKGVGVGTGLGLSISYNIIKNHHGEIRVNSEPGAGAEFIIKLPMTQK